MLRVGQILEEFSDLLSRLRVAGLHVLQAGDDLFDLTAKEAGHCGFHPLGLLGWRVPELGSSHLMEMLTAVLVDSQLA